MFRATLDEIQKDIPSRTGIHELHIQESLRVADFPLDIQQMAVREWDNLCPKCKKTNRNGHSIIESTGLDAKNKQILRLEVKKALSALSWKERRIITSLYFRGLKLEVVAKRMRIPFNEAEALFCSAGLKIMTCISEEAVQIAVPQEIWD